MADPPTHGSLGNVSQGVERRLGERDVEIPLGCPLRRDPSEHRNSFASRIQAPAMERVPTGRGFSMKPLGRSVSFEGTLQREPSKYGSYTIPTPSLGRETTGDASQASSSVDSSFYPPHFLLQRDCTSDFKHHIVSPVAQVYDDKFFEEQGEQLEHAIRVSRNSSLFISNETGVLGGAWRGTLRRLMESQYDEINALLLSRILQLFMPFLTGFEALLCGRLIEALDSSNLDEVRKHLKTAMMNRNVSRAIVANLGDRYDWLWHVHTWLTYNRLLDGWGQFPVVGITAFPSTENFPATKNHALASTFRVILGEGNWITRVLTGGREGLVTDNPKNTAQNLAAESNNFELANNSQYGTTHGRIKTNEFRLHHRLPTDESLIRTFVTSPSSTTVNNGVMHVLLGLSRHWHNMLRQPWGNFAHQRMEQLDPFETLRFQMPQMLLLVTNLRGRNVWDAQVLGPVIKRLQMLKPSANVEHPVRDAKSLAIELRDMLHDVCAGVSAWHEPFASWLDAIIMSFDKISEKASEIFDLLMSVEAGIRVGYDCMVATNWKVPNDHDLEKAILHCWNDKSDR